MAIVRRRLPRSTQYPKVVGTAPIKKVDKDIGDTSREPTQLVLSQSAEGKAKPIIYGRRKVAGIYPVVAGKNHGLRVMYVLSTGPIESIDTYWVGDYEKGSLPAGVAVEEHLGTWTQLVSTALSGAIAGYTQEHPGVAYVVVSVDPTSELYGSIPEFSAVVKGRNDVYDPRLDVTPGADPTNPLYQDYTANPALIAGHIWTSYDMGNCPTASVDWAKVATAANTCDRQVDSEERYSIGLLISERMLLREAIAAALAPCRGYERWENGLWSPAFDDFTAPAMTVDAACFASESAAGTDTYALDEGCLSTDEMPESVRVRYVEPDRGWEEYEQRHPPGMTPGGATRELEVSTPAIVADDVAARVAEETWRQRRRGRRLTGTFNRKVSRLERGDIVELLLPAAGISRTSLKFETDAYGTSGATIGLDLNGDGTVEARFRCLGTTGATQAIVDRWNGGTGQYGYALLVTSTGYLAVRWGTTYTAVTTDAYVADGCWHHVAMTVEEGFRIKVILDGAIAYQDVGVAGNVAGNVDTSIGARTSGGTLIPFYGWIEEVRIWGSAKTEADIERLAWRDDSAVNAEPGLVARWQMLEGSGAAVNDPVGGFDLSLAGTYTWGTRGETVRVTSVAPKPDGTVDLQLAETYGLSYATGVVLSTGDEPVTRVDTKSPPSVPQPTDVAPAVTGLTLTVVEVEIAGAKEYRIKAEWTVSQSGYVRCYEVKLECAAVGATEIIGQFARHCDECLMHIIRYGESHKVKVTPIATSGVRGTSANASITPGVTLPTLSIALTAAASGGYYAPWQNKGSNAFWGAVSYKFSITLSSSTNVDYLEVLQNDHPIGMLDKTCAAFAVGNGRLWNVNDYPAYAVPTFFGIQTNGGDVIKLRAVIVDGRTVTSAGVTLSSATYLGFVSSASAEQRDLLAVASNEATFHGAVGSTPTAMKFPWMSSEPDWEWGACDAGKATIEDGNTAVTVTLTGTMPSTNYGIGIAVEGSTEIVYVLNVTTTSFDLERDNDVGDRVVRWVAMYTD